MTPDLGAAAAAEADRLALARSLMREDDGLALARLEAGRPWIALARSKLRRRLGGRRIEIWRVACEDASGRSVESRLVPLAIDAVLAGTTRGSAGSPRACLDVGAVVEASSRDWRLAAARAVAAFTSARLRRESAIAAIAAETSRAAGQPGLFDRRELRALTLAEAARDAAAAEAAARKAAFERSAAIEPAPPALLLVVTGQTRRSAPTGVPSCDAARR